MNAKAISIDGVYFLVNAKMKINCGDYYLYKGRINQRMSINDCSDGSQFQRVFRQAKIVYSDLPLFTPPWVEDVEALADQHVPPFTVIGYKGDQDISGINKRYFIDGYNHHAERYKWTDEDMEEIIGNIMDDDFIHSINNRSEMNAYVKKQIAHYISQPSTYSVEYEIKDGLITITNYQKI